MGVRPKPRITLWEHVALALLDLTQVSQEILKEVRMMRRALKVPTGGTMAVPGHVIEDANRLKRKRSYQPRPGKVLPIRTPGQAALAARAARREASMKVQMTTPQPVSPPDLTKLTEEQLRKLEQGGDE